MRNPVLLAASLAAFSSVIHAAETVHAVVTVQRHGDRTYKGNPPTSLTSLGALQVHNAGTFYRNRYLVASSPFYIDGISQGSFDDKEVYAMAPDQPLLVTSGQVFLQGLYPPNTYNKPQPLANGDLVQDPVNGLQYTTLHSISTTDPSTIWLKGDDGCTNQQVQSTAYLNSPEFHRIDEESQPFYNSLKKDYLNGVFRDGDVGYQSAYQIFDYINVGALHNTTIANRISPGELYKLKVLADRHEWAISGNASLEHPALTIVGRTMAYKVAERLAINVKTAGAQNKFTLLISSYDGFLAFFGHSGLSASSPDFMGLPNYAASMVFELFSDVNTTAGEYPSESDLQVRFYFRNGTEDGVPLKSYSIFGSTESVISWKEFNEEVDEFAVKNVNTWCEVCGASESFCPENSQTGDSTNSGNDSKNGVTNDDKPHTENSRRKDRQPLSPGAAGAVGAVGAIALVLLGLGIAMAVFGVRFGRSKKETVEKGFPGGKRLPSDVDLEMTKQQPVVFASKM